MSVKHPIISVTGSSGAGTTTVKSTFERIFTREKIQAAWIEGDAFHRYGRDDMRRAMAEAGLAGNNHFSHFGPEANLLTELEQVFAVVTGLGMIVGSRGKAEVALLPLSLCGFVVAGSGGGQPR